MAVNLKNIFHLFNYIPFNSPGIYEVNTGFSVGAPFS